MSPSASSRARPRKSFVCGGCGAEFGTWYGRCPKCAEFGTLAEAAPAATAAVGLRASGAGTTPARPARRLTDISEAEVGPRVGTGLAEFDRVLGGGLVTGQVLLLSGEPGAGKSTLLLTTADAVARATGRPVLYVSGEESVHQIATRARRIGATHEQVYLADGNDLAQAIGHLDALGPDVALMILDSVQTVASADVEGRAGGVAQVMEVASTLTRLAKARGIAVCLVGQVTKESTVAGPRALEHVVDTTLSLDGDRQTPLRLLRAVKNRFGPADEVACFEQTDAGMVEVPDPSSLFRGVRDEPVAGTCITVTVEGRRPLLAEMQALVSPSGTPNPRRGVSGLDSARVAMLIAVTERIAGLRLADKDVYAATVGGMRSSDPASDLAICLAIASAATGKPLPLDVAAIGEVSLSGDIRRVTMAGQRIAEAARLGHGRILVPAGTREAVRDLRLGAVPAHVVEVSTIHQALTALDASPRPRPVRQPDDH
ncbi:DNA repair protein RadA [Nocardioides sp. TRM66260-LWL]|uniref:DNA repair protein RadA n=1 Tax=Nocardioides sp. TRM66260-LWL TaxID=2874478 RepID=UPI001CC6E9A5|nr:DNA repair protein RadA [Nocardioides sp. TRM66260-LWL]MBZ5734866.1 DNA repair protein RadA [Nocardioides sp. TRM66260-LWL]